MKQIATIILACIIGLSMTMTPSLMAERAYADDVQVDETQQTAETTAEEPDAAADETQQAAETTAEEPDAAVDAAQQTAEMTAEELDAEDVDSAESDADSAEATEESGVAEGSALEGLAGMNISDIENDPELSFVLEDPTFYRYYEVDEDGVIHEKAVDFDEVEQFIMEADANAEGIDDVDNVETNGDITAMGGGVSGLGKAQTPSKYAGYKRYHCIDISWWQGKISDSSWKKIKAAGVTHVIARCGYSTLSGGEHNIDSTFSNNVNGARKVGIKVGVYYYSTAVSASEAKSEARYVVSLLSKYKSKITLPVAFDYETGGRLTSKVMKRAGTASCTAFCDTIRAAGYTPMVYANYNTLMNYIDYKTLQKKYRIWLANYTTNGVATTYPGKYWMWQYSSSGRINGLSKVVDINYIYAPKKSSKSSSTKYGKATVTCSMHYRKGPGPNKKAVGVYKKGKVIKIKKFCGNWAKMTNGYYIHRSHLRYKAKTTDSVNYRTGPGTNYKRLGTFKKGKTITIVKVKNGWAKTKDGKWLAVKYTKIKK